MHRKGRMKICDLDIKFPAGGTADIPLPGACLKIRGRGGCVPGEQDDVVFLTQVHGAGLVHDPSGGEEADGMIIRGSDRAAGIKTADCLPVFIKSHGYAAAFHAGWRGLSRGIAARMMEEFPEKPDFVVLGNCICSNCYHVGEDVREALLRTALSGSHPPGRIDLKKLVLDQMITAGLPDGSDVYNVPECTMCRPDLFFSYRYDVTDERNLQWIVIT